MNRGVGGMKSLGIYMAILAGLLWPAAGLRAQSEGIFRIFQNYSKSASGVSGATVPQGASSQVHKDMIQFNQVLFHAVESGGSVQNYCDHLKQQCLADAAQESYSLDFNRDCYDQYEICRHDHSCELQRQACYYAGQNDDQCETQYESCQNLAKAQAPQTCADMRHRCYDVYHKSDDQCEAEYSACLNPPPKQAAPQTCAEKRIYCYDVVHKPDDQCEAEYEACLNPPPKVAVPLNQIHGEDLSLQQPPPAPTNCRDKRLYCFDVAHRSDDSCETEYDSCLQNCSAQRIHCFDIGRSDDSCETEYDRCRGT